MPGALGGEEWEWEPLEAEAGRTLGERMGDGPKPGAEAEICMSGVKLGEAMRPPMAMRPGVVMRRAGSERRAQGVRPMPERGGSWEEALPMLAREVLGDWRRSTAGGRRGV